MPTLQVCALPCCGAHGSLIGPQHKPSREAECERGTRPRSKVDDFCFSCSFGDRLVARCDRHRAHAADARRGRARSAGGNEGPARCRRQVRNLLSPALGDRTPRLFQRARDRCGDCRCPERRPCPAVADRRQRRRGRGHFRPHHPDASQGAARRRGAAIRALPRFCARHPSFQGHCVCGAAEPQGPEDRCHLTGIEHAFHGGVYARAQRFQSR